MSATGSAPAGLVDASPLLAVATDAARAAGDLLVERFRTGRERPIGYKSSPTDLVSEADRAAERAIRGVILDNRPDDSILGEEGGETPGESELRWIVDPLDGTVNFLSGIPQWCVSVAVHDAAGGLCGVVLDPIRDELFAGQRGGEATCNGSPLSGSTRSDLATSVVATGFSYDPEVRRTQGEVLARLLPVVSDVRRMGGAALEMAWTAAGRYDAFYERGIKIWDTAAGSVLCGCAGVDVLELEERPGFPWGALAAPPGLIGELARIVT